MADIKAKKVLFKNRDGESLIPYIGEDYVKNDDMVEVEFANAGSYIAGCAMPSGQYVGLTVGASGTSYTAPANGYFCIRGKASSANISFVAFWANDSVGARSYAYTSGAEPMVYIPAKKGQVVYATYNNVTDVALNFFYAEGEVE